jgi:hypothetical protein
MRANLPEGADRKARKAETERIEGLIRGDCPKYFAAIEGMCHGTKHCGRDDNRGAEFTPGREKVVPPFGFGVAFAGFGQGRWGAPGMLVPVADDEVFVDSALGYFLLACVQRFPEHIRKISRADWMPQSGQAEPHARP